jgi:phosphate-selective porin OprO and OprP
MQLGNRMGTIRRLAAGAALLVATASSAAAQDGLTPREREMMETIKRLESRVGELERARVEDKNGEQLETQINAINASMLEIPDSASLAAKFDIGGLSFTSEDKSFRLKITGRLQDDWTFAGQSDELAASVQHLEDGFRMRRARLGAQGEVYKHIEFKMEWDFAQGDADFTDVYVGLVNLGDFLYGVRVGQFKEPMGLDELTSDGFITFVEKAAILEALTPSRNNGLMLHGNAFDNRMSWQAGFFRDTDNFGDSSSSTNTAAPGSSNRQEDGKYAGSMRVTGVPWYEDKGEYLLHLGASFRYANPGNDEFIVQSRPENRSMPVVISSGDFPVDDFIAFGIELAAVIGPLGFKAELIGADFSGENSGDAEPFFWGWYAEVSYFLTGEHLPYKLRNGVFDRVKPIDYFLNEEGGMGAWQLALRFDQADLNDDGIQGGELDTLTFGVNWYLNPHTEIKFDFSWASLEDGPGGDDGDAYIFTIRFQFDF